MKHVKLLLLVVLTTLFSCSEQELITPEKQAVEKEAIQVSARSSNNELRIVTYNYHGGHNFMRWSNTRKFKDLLQGEDILFLQEVKPDQVWIVKWVFNDYPYVYYSLKKATKPGKNKKEGILTLSKLPLVVKHEKIIQIDPQVDMWERKAQHVAVQSNGQRVDFFHYHNTYNFNENNFASEREGMQKFAQYGLDRLGANSIGQTTNAVFLGDFNVYDWHINESLPTSFHKSFGRDHINTNMNVNESGVYDTMRQGISDHNAIWATVRIQ